MTEPAKGRRWYRHPRQQAAVKPPVIFPDVMFYGPYLDCHDTWIGMYWKHDVQGWDGGWWEGWRFYLVLLPTTVLRMDVDRSGRDTLAFRRWKRETGQNPRPNYRRWKAYA
jgi:hypothetical protein